MGKHILDRPRETSSMRTTHFMALARKDAPHRSTRALQKRARAEKPLADALREGRIQGSSA